MRCSLRYLYPQEASTVQSQSIRRESDNDTEEYSSTSGFHSVAEVPTNDDMHQTWRQVYKWSLVFSNTQPVLHGGTTKTIWSRELSISEYFSSVYVKWQQAQYLRVVEGAFLVDPSHESTYGMKQISEAQVPQHVRARDVYKTHGGSRAAPSANINAMIFQCQCPKPSDGIRTPISKADCSLRLIAWITLAIQSIIRGARWREPEGPKICFVLSGLRLAIWLKYSRNKGVIYSQREFKDATGRQSIIVHPSQDRHSDLHDLSRILQTSHDDGQMNIQMVIYPSVLGVKSKSHKGRDPVIRPPSQTGHLTGV
ncbi:hypothetical protein BC629DRAFT_1443502 [Irpex lacteus]|nr:hypothetical protein BC629DRAFT_1443502 [Irpex lacteus]